MLQPKRTKYRKQFKGRIANRAKAGTTLSFGSFGIKSLDPERVTARQIEAARRAITRHMKRQGRVWIRIFPDLPVTSKPTEVRMGKGKGTFEYWAARSAIPSYLSIVPTNCCVSHRVPAEKILFEVGGTGVRREMAHSGKHGSIR